MTRAAACWFILLIAWLTWSPFTFHWPASSLEWMPRRAWHDLAGNVLLLAPIGVLVALHTRRNAVLYATLSALVLSSIIEAGQLFLPDRMAAGSDIALNTAGAALAAALALRAKRVWPPRRILGAAIVLTYGVFLTFVIYSGVKFRSAARLSDWRPEFGIRAGNEINADRTYVGVVEDAAICAGDGPTRICANANADRPIREQLVAVAEASQNVVVHARAISQSDHQKGPTRILTFSDGAYARNITLAQEETSLVVRIRMPLSGGNGRDYELHIPNVMKQGVATGITVAFVDGVVTAVVVDDETAHTFRMSFDALAGGVLMGGPGSITPEEIGRVRVATAIVLAFPLFLLITPGHYHLARVKRFRIPGRRRALDPA